MNATEIRTLVKQYRTEVETSASPTYEGITKKYEGKLYRNTTAKTLKEYGKMVGVLTDTPSTEYGTGKVAYVRRALHLNHLA